MSKLEPCPFCGSNDIDPNGCASQLSEFGPLVTRPACDNCGATTDVSWNTRAAPKVKALRWFKLRELCHVSSPCDNLEYRVIEQGLDFFVTINGERFGSSNSVGLAQAMAHGHFEKLILEALV
jgi:hypothetical protein